MMPTDTAPLAANGTPLAYVTSAFVHTHKAPAELNGSPLDQNTGLGSPAVAST